MGGDAALELDVYGLHVRVSCSWPDAMDELRRDFWWFRSESPRPGVSPLELEIVQAAPDFDRFGPLRSAFITPRNVVYQSPRGTVVDYFGKAVLEVDRATGRATVEGEDLDLVREASSNFLVSRIGEHLNARGLVRLHALGLAGRAGAVAIVMPSGGGKSTLALQALATNKCKLLSEDSPVLDRHGRLHPFPMRIGVNPTDAERIPAGLIRRTQERIEFHPKLALDVESFADRIEPESQPLRHLVIGRRTLERKGRLDTLGRRNAVGPLLREAVIGVGVYQGMEFVLQRGWIDVVGKAGTAGRRAFVVGSALRQARVWQLWVGRDRESTWDALRPLL